VRAVTYRCGTQGLGRLGIADSEPTITCNGSGCEQRIVINGLPPEWFLDGKHKPGWSKTGDGGERKDYCPTCTRKRKVKP
jgi:hypothetical protein